MVEISLEIEADPVRVLPVPVTAVDVVLLTGPGRFAGWSLRDASGGLPQENAGQVTSPGAGATICSVPIIAGVTYDYQWTVELTGAAAAADVNNFELLNSGAGVAPSLNPGAAGVYPQAGGRFVCIVTGVARVEALAAGTVGVTYGAQLSVVPTNSVDAVVEFQDGNNPLGESTVPANGTDSHTFMSDALKVRNQIKLHVVSGAVTGAVYARFAKTTG